MDSHLSTGDLRGGLGRMIVVGNTTRTGVVCHHQTVNMTIGVLIAEGGATVSPTVGNVKASLLVVKVHPRHHRHRPAQPQVLNLELNN